MSLLLVTLIIYSPLKEHHTCMSTQTETEENAANSHVLQSRDGAPALHADVLYILSYGSLVLLILQAKTFLTIVSNWDQANQNHPFTVNFNLFRFLLLTLYRCEK